MIVARPDLSAIQGQPREGLEVPAVRPPFANRESRIAMRDPDFSQSSRAKHALAQIYWSNPLELFFTRNIYCRVTAVEICLCS